MMASEDVFAALVNIGNLDEFTVLRPAQKIISATASRSLEFEPLPSDDPCQRQPDIAPAGQRSDGWVPGNWLKEGLSPTIAFFEGAVAATGG